MTAYQFYRQKLIDQGNITSSEAKAFFTDLFEISTKRIFEEVGPDFFRYFPTTQYRGPGGLRSEVNGWKYKNPIGVCDHFTASDSHQSAIKWFSSYEKWNKGSGVVGPSGASACFVVALSGEPFLLIDFWNGKADWHEPQLNGLAIGIEHVNCGELRERNGKFYWWASNWGAAYPYMNNLPPQPVDYRGCKWMQPYTKSQIFTNLLIKRALICLYNNSENIMRPELFVDHAMYRDDKTDQGPLWPLNELRTAAFSWEPLKNHPFYEAAQTDPLKSFNVVNSLDMPNMHRMITRQGFMPVDLHMEPNTKSGILAVQLALSSLKYSTPTDGRYNDAYVAAVKKFQQDNGLKADGIPGPVTRTALSNKLNKPAGT